MGKTLLATGFEPFRHHRLNSSWEALTLLRDRWPGEVSTLLLPVHRQRAHHDLRRALVKERPWAVLCTGLAEGDGFRIETRARRPPELASVVGADELHGAWPWSEMQEALQSAGIPCRHSSDAGSYVCESTYWSLLSHRSLTQLPRFAAFLHVPPIGDEFPTPRIAAGMEEVIEARLNSRRAAQPLTEPPAS